MSVAFVDREFLDIMTRKKIVLEPIANESTRKATYKKRKKGLLKKVSELSTLCGINACALIYSPYDPQPEIWPPSHGAVRRVLTKFREMPAMERSKKMLNHEGFLTQRIAKANEQLRKLRKDNREKEMIHVMYQCLTAKDLLLNLNLVDLNDLGWVIDNTVKEIDRRVETLTTNVEPRQMLVARFEGAPVDDHFPMNRQPWYMNHAMPAQPGQDAGPILPDVNADNDGNMVQNFYR
ncbi:hypothetical protein MLD38_015624 [Melastoma candidum]|uniref:Uncharacterized protein n=1 Tax=Melastoma candidum TaxID=119954 RepID=A0ACB9RGI2_9MYRT|nr:hypothetical protein MLD38_015624 [Melastoma candidum]